MKQLPVLKAYFNDDEYIEMLEENEIHFHAEMLKKQGKIEKLSDLKIKSDDLEIFRTTKTGLLAKETIDKELEASGIDYREQLVTTANGLQVSLLALSTIIVACSKSEDTALKEGTKDLLPFASNFLEARGTGDMPMDILGIENVSEKVIKTSMVSGRVVKQVLSAGKS